MKYYLLSFLKGILAGLAIGVGGFLYILMTHYVPGELGKVLGATLFAVGLFTVCACSLHLYTGKIGIIYEGKQEKRFYICLPIMLVGNLIGAVSLGLICFAIFRNTDVMNTVNSVCSSRTTLFTFNDYLACMVKSFLCGICVYLAVKAFNLNKFKPLGIVLLVLFVFIFVYSGFQHCIANMFYFGFGCHFNLYTFVNMLFCILFNSLGPVAAVAFVKLLNQNK